MSIYKRKDGSSPYYQYEFEIDKKRFRGSTKCTSHREAKAFERAEREKQLAALKAPVVVEEAAEPTCAEVFARFWRSHAPGLNPDWANEVKYHMEEALAIIGPDTPISRWTGAVVAEVLDEYASSRNKLYTKTPEEDRPLVSNRTVNKRGEIIRMVYMKARDVWEMPVANIKWGLYRRRQARERVRHITAEEARHVVRALPPHIQLMVAWSLATGCRLSETYSLKRSRINYETLQVMADTKGGGVRYIDLNADAIAILSLCPSPPGGANDHYIFDTTNRRKHWEAAVAAVGLDDFHWHDLRHTFATWLGTSGAGLHVIQKALGHSRIETTMKYLHVIRADVRDAVAKLPTIIESDVVPMKKLEKK